MHKVDGVSMYCTRLKYTSNACIESYFAAQNDVKVKSLRGKTYDWSRRTALKIVKQLHAHAQGDSATLYIDKWLFICVYFFIECRVGDDIAVEIAIPT